MTTENKAEAEKIAEEVEHGIYAAFDAVDNEECTCFSNPEGSCPRCAAWEKARRITRDTITQALLDFREKDVRELVAALEKLNVRNKVYGFESDALQAFKMISYDDIDALVRKFKGGAKQ